MGTSPISCQLKVPVLGLIPYPSLVPRIGPDRRSELSEGFLQQQPRLVVALQFDHDTAAHMGVADAAALATKRLASAGPRCGEPGGSYASRTPPHSHPQLPHLTS